MSYGLGNAKWLVHLRNCLVDVLRIQGSDLWVWGVSMGVSVYTFKNCLLGFLVRRRPRSKNPTNNSPPPQTAVWE